MDVAVIGAGPYGLSLAAHLRNLGIDCQIFGRPMDAWTSHMPEGMLLKSEGFASNLYDPKGEYSLAKYCREHAIPYHDQRIPVPVEAFADYGLEFARRFAPDLRDTLVVSLRREADRFTLTCANGDIDGARRVVVATGIGPYAWLPRQLSKIPREYVSHSYDHHDLSGFSGQSVAVVGAGASAVDLACLLADRGAKVALICRRDKLIFGTRPSDRGRSLWEQLKRPSSGLGPGWRSRLSTDAPLLFHVLPASLRHLIVRRHLGPAAGWPMREKFENRVSLLAGREILDASLDGAHVRLSSRRVDGAADAASFDHVVAATGYRVDISRLKFIDEALRSEIACVEETPILSSRFESSVKGLFFIGTTAANSFGPMLRFAFGARFAARRVSNALKPAARLAAVRRPTPAPA